MKPSTLEEFAAWLRTRAWSKHAEADAASLQHDTFRANYKRAQGVALDMAADDLVPIERVKL